MTSQQNGNRSKEKEISRTSTQTEKQQNQCDDASCTPDYHFQNNSSHPQSWLFEKRMPVFTDSIQSGMVRKMLLEDSEPIVQILLAHRVELVRLQEELGRRLLQDSVPTACLSTVGTGVLPFVVRKLFFA